VLDQLDPALEGVVGMQSAVTRAQPVDQLAQGGVRVDELHREEVLALVGHAHVVHGEQVGVLELPADLRLLHEAAQDLAVVVGRGEDLHRHAPL